MDKVKSALEDLDNLVTRVADNEELLTLEKENDVPRREIKLLNSWWNKLPPSIPIVDVNKKSNEEKFNS